MNLTDKPFLYRGGNFLDTVDLIKREHESKPSTDISLNLRNEGLLSIPVSHMNPLLIAIVERMFDENTLTMEVAERLQYLCQSILMDAAEYRETVMMEAGEDF